MEKAAEELGYHKSECRRARKLTGQKLIAVFCPTLTNPYYVMLLQGIEEIAKESGYTVFVCNTLRDLKTEESCLRMLRQIQPMGIIYTCNPSACFQQEILALSENIPLVVIKNRDLVWKWMWWNSTTRSRDGSWPASFGAGAPEGRLYFATSDPAAAAALSAGGRLYGRIPGSGTSRGRDRKSGG